jgi:RsiW-degrading membrane proteinase PrsW (M82 family)
MRTTDAANGRDITSLGQLSLHHFKSCTSPQLDQTKRLLLTSSLPPRSVVGEKSDYTHRMDTQKSRWRQPGFIALIAVVFLINLVVDWFVFKPKDVALFIVVEALVLGGIAWLVIACTSPHS